MDLVFNPTRALDDLKGFWQNKETGEISEVPAPAWRIVEAAHKNKVRREHRPNFAMRKLHRHLNSTLVFGFRTIHERKDSIATAFWPGRSPLANVKRHWRNRFFYSIDIKDAYDSTPGIELAQIIDGLGLRAIGQGESIELWRHFLAQHCLTESGGLPFGSPSAPTLFNLYCDARLDRQLEAIARRFAITITRYADDITASSRNRIPEAAKRMIRDAVRTAGFRLNEKKSFSGDLFAGHPICITGILLFWNGWHKAARLALSQDFRKKLRWLLYQAVYGANEELGYEHIAAIHGLHGTFKQLGEPGKNQLDREIDSLYSKLKFQEEQLRQGSGMRINPDTFWDTWDDCVNPPDDGFIFK